MFRVLSSVMWILGLSSALTAQSIPEVDTSTGITAMALVAAAVLVFQSRKRE